MPGSAVFTALTWAWAAGAAAQATTPSPDTTSAADPHFTSAQSVAAGSRDATTSSIEYLRQMLGRGDHVDVTDARGATWRGRIVRVGADDIELDTRAVQPGSKEASKVRLTVPLADIQALERHRDPATNGALIGAGIGAGVGIAFFAHAYAIDANEMDEWAGGYVLWALITTGIGTVAGWAIDIVHSKPEFGYAPERPRAMQVRLTPMVGRKSAGVAMAITF